MTHKTRHDMAHGRQADTNTSTAPASWKSTLGPHGEHREAPRGTDGALPPAGGVHMNGTGDTGRTATEHREIPDGGLCMQHCRGGAGKRAPNLEKRFYSVPTTCHYFLPHGGQTAHSKNVPCRPHATGTNQHRNKQNTRMQQIRLRKRPLQRQGTNAERTDEDATNTTPHQQNRYNEHDVTINRLQARRPTPNWPDMHGPVREQRPTGWRHRGEPRPQTTMTTNTEEHRNSTTADVANQRSENYTTLHLDKPRSN